MERATYPTCLDIVLKFLEQSIGNGYLVANTKSHIQTMILDLKFFKMFFWMLSYCEDSQYDWHFLFSINAIVPKLSQTIEEFIVDYECAQDHKDQEIIWEAMIHNLEKRIIHQFKPRVKEICVLILTGSCKLYESLKHKLKSSVLEQGKEITSFIEFILHNLSALRNSSFDLGSNLKQQIVFIQQKLREFPRFSSSANPSITRVKKLSELMSQTRTWVKHISCLVCLYWIQTPSSVAETIMLSDLVKDLPYSPGIIASYLEDTMISQLLASYFDFLLEDLVLPVKNGIEVLREGLIFLVSFATNPPMEDLDDREMILPQIYCIINELPSLVSSILCLEEGISRTNFLVFLQKINEVKANIRKLYATIPHSTELNSPRTNPTGFLDSLLRTLERMLEANASFITSTNHQMGVLCESLKSLRMILRENIWLQNEDGKLRDLWTRAIDLVYHAAYVTHFYPPKSFSVWYSIAGLPNVIEDIKLIETEFQKLDYHEKLKDKLLCAEMESSIVVSPTEEFFIGFQEETESIIDSLVHGQKDLTVISISGMPGQGKTTLAKKVYKDPQVQYHFHRIAWCYVSNQCKAIELLKEIGRVLIGTNNASKLELADLVDWLRKSFKKKRYLIVMDDIWDVELWYQVKGSFPNDSNGSRILFTTRNHDLASGVDLHCISHRLRLFSKEESQELMEKKLFQGNGGAQAELLEISKLIASLCEGLPLAVALSSSILCRTERQPDLWFEVALNLKTHLASEGCGKVIELSYKYLQDHLKSCFLYLGSFPRGASICTSELKQLWIAEGFIKDDEMHCSEDLANEYLDNLVSQNLVVLVEKSSLGGIKKCNVHDLLYDFCLEKAKEENFLSWSEESLIMDSCKFTPRRCSQYRLSIRTDDPFIMEKSVCVRKELPTSQVHSYLWFHPTHTLNFWFAESFRVLKVLNLEQVYLECDRFPQLILFNIHLKYLVLNFGYRQIECIPWSIGNLWNLETLIVIAKQLDDPLPDSMWKMKRLRHVKLCRFRLGLWSEEFGENDSFMGNHIETLGELDLGLYDSKTTEFLRKLPNLKKLHCHIEDKERFRMWFSLFGSLTQLQSLFIDGDFYEPPSSVSPPPFNFSKNLKKLSLWGLYIPWSRMSMIAKVLPDLHVLKLANEACVGSRWNLEDGDFPKLKYLKLDHLNVEEMDASGCDDNPFPCLEQLFVKNCHKLKDIPSFFEEIYTLKTIQMIGSSCEANDSARRILSSQQEMGNNDLQVFILRESNSNTYRLSHVADNNLKLPDWRTNLLPDSRRRIRNKIMETLWRCVPFFCGSGELKEIKKIATKFEDKIYTVATSQEEYLRKISLKMLTMEENRTPTT